jgi:hypothetical protein
MGLIRRVTLSVAAAVTLLAALTVASVGAAGGFGQAPGRYTFNDTTATASFFNPVDQSNQNISVDRSLFRFKPKGGGGITTQNMTILSVDVFVPSPDPTQPPITAASGCFVIPDSEFVVSGDLQHASVSATVNASDACPGSLAPVLGGAPAKGGGGGGGGFTFPLTITGSWTGTGLVGVSDDKGSFRCGGFASTTDSRSQSALSSAVSAAIGAFSVGPQAFGTVNVSKVQMQVTGSGILPAGCQGGGKG